MGLLSVAMAFTLPYYFYYSAMKDRFSNLDYSRSMENLYINYNAIIRIRGLLSHHGYNRLSQTIQPLQEKLYSEISNSSEKPYLDSAIWALEYYNYNIDKTSPRNVANSFANICSKIDELNEIKSGEALAAISSYLPRYVELATDKKFYSGTSEDRMDIINQLSKCQSANTNIDIYFYSTYISALALNHISIELEENSLQCDDVAIKYLERIAATDYHASNYSKPLSIFMNKFKTLNISQKCYFQGSE